MQNNFALCRRKSEKGEKTRQKIAWKKLKISGKAEKINSDKEKIGLAR